jgi:hypothetical protein
MGINKDKLRATLDREIAEAQAILASLKRSRQTLNGIYVPPPGSLAAKAYDAIRTMGPINGDKLAKAIDVSDPSARAVLNTLYEKCAIQRTSSKMPNPNSARPSYQYFV